MPLFGKSAKTAKKNKGNLASYGFPTEKPSGMYYPGQTFIQPERWPVPPPAPPAKPLIEPLENVLRWNTSRPKTFAFQSPTVKNVGQTDTGKHFQTELAPEPTVPATTVSTPASLTIKAPNTPPSPNTNGLSLPKGWAMRLNNDGQVYFEDVEGGTTQWNFPSNAPLPNGWSEAFDETKVKFYTHPEKNSSWYRPAPNGTRRNKANKGSVSNANVQRLKNLEAKLNTAEKRAANAAKALANAQNKTKKNRNANLNTLRKKLEEAERRAAEAEKKLMTAAAAPASTTNAEEKPQLGLAALMAKRAAETASAPVVVPSNTRAEKFKKMLKMGVPEGAVKAKMSAEGVPHNVVFGATITEVAAIAPSSNNARLNKFKKMQKMGVPQPGIEQKMIMEGVEPALLFGGPPRIKAAPVGPPAFLANIGKGVAGLKKANTTRKNNKATGPVDPKAGLMAELAKKVQGRAGPSLENIEARLKRNAAASGPKNGLMAELGAKLKKRTGPTVANIEASLQQPKEKPETGFQRFKAELAEKARQKNMKKQAAQNKTKKRTPGSSNRNNKGVLPKPWIHQWDEEDDWYVNPTTGVSQWERPTEVFNNTW